MKTVIADKKKQKEIKTEAGRSEIFSLGTVFLYPSKCCQYCSSWLFETKLFQQAVVKNCNFFINTNVNHYEPKKGTVEHILDGHLREWRGDHLKQVPQIKIIIKKRQLMPLLTTQ